MKDLTEKQKNVLKFICDHILNIGFPPTRREIAINSGVTVRCAQDHMRALEKKGYVQIEENIARGIKVLRTVE